MSGSWTIPSSLADEELPSSRSSAVEVLSESSWVRFGDHALLLLRLGFGAARGPCSVDREIPVAFCRVGIWRGRFTSQCRP